MKALSNTALTNIAGGMNWIGNRMSMNVEDRRTPGVVGLPLPDGSWNWSNPDYGNEGRNYDSGGRSEG